MFRVVTVSREYGSGGGHIARLVSERLGWELLDKTLIHEIARAAKVHPDVAREHDERVDSWLHRLSRRALWHGAFEGVAAVTPTDVFDAETMALLARHLIEEAHKRGSCVIVGRGAQCVLRDREDAFHVFVHAPWAERVARVRRRVSEQEDIEGLIREMDAQRADFIRLHFGCDWSDPHLYHMLVNSTLGEDLTASMIVDAVARSRSGSA